jgi:hypothetical protein
LLLPVRLLPLLWDERSFGLGKKIEVAFAWNANVSGEGKPKSEAG